MTDTNRRIFNLRMDIPELQRMEIAIKIFSETEDKDEAKRLLTYLKDRFITNRRPNEGRAGTETA